MTPSDVSSAVHLAHQAGWNQLESDWARLLEHEPQGCFVADVDGRIVGTVTSTAYGNDLAWIGMMLVHESYRRQGIASELMTRCLNNLRSRSIRCIKLDATPVGEPVYEKLGFQAEWTFHRWCVDTIDPQHLLDKGDSETGTVVSRGQQLFDSNTALDHVAFGTDRVTWLKRLTSDSDCIATGQGFGMMRSGHLANYLGPIIAETPTDAMQIARRLLLRSTTRVFWDIPGPNRDAVALAKSFGFRPVRDLTRMWIGDGLLPCDLSHQYALSDPGTG
ncbi:MAG: GNAT family N-acetyltransferase [Rubripirellula sp.]